MYDIRGADGTGTSANPVPYNSPNAKSYTVRKLADGNCWMTENLALPLAAGVTVEAASNTAATPVSFTPTSCSTDGACSMNGNTLAGNSTRYYSWYAATAETGTSSDVGIDAPASICPVGWRLPTDYQTDSVNRSYGLLTNTYGFTSGDANANSEEGHAAALESIPFDFARRGYYRGGSLTNNGTSGHYWSSAAYPTNAQWARQFRYGASFTYAVSAEYKYPGLNVRCVAL